FSLKVILVFHNEFVFIVEVGFVIDNSHIHNKRGASKFHIIDFAVNAAAIRTDKPVDCVASAAGGPIAMQVRWLGLNVQSFIGHHAADHEKRDESESD